MEDLKRILFIDIETVACEGDFNFLSEGMQEQWARKAKNLKVTDGVEATSAMLFSERAGIFSEFAKIVCIGIGCLVEHNGEWKIILKALTSSDEKALLNQFCDSLSKFTNKFPDLQFCGHNIKEFDIPFISRRMIIHGMHLPTCMNNHGKKPWEIKHIDTMELWSFGDRKNYTTLALLAEVLGIPSPKDDINGSMVSEVFWSAKNEVERELALERIGTYCVKDVLTTAKVYLRLAGYSHVHPEPQIIRD